MRDWRRFLQRFGPLIALLVLIVGTAVVEAIRVPPENRAFLTPRNFINILGQWSFVGIVAIGMTFVIVLAGIDLSVGSMVALAAGVAVYAMNAASERFGADSPLPILVAAGVCLGMGPILGAVNGLLVGVGRIAPFVATLGTMAMFRALILAPAEGGEIRSARRDFGEIARWGIDLPYALGGTPPEVLADGATRPGIPLSIRSPVLAFAAVAALAHVVLTRTTLGLRITAIGDNARAARYAGIRIPSTTVIVYAISGATCGIAALFNASRLNSVASSSLGGLYELDAIAAVVIGGTRLQGGAGRIWGTVVGVLILGIVGNMLNMLGVSTFYHGLVKGMIIIAAVLLQPARAAD